MHMYLNLSLSLSPLPIAISETTQRDIHVLYIYILYDKERVSYTNHANTSLGK